MACQRSDSTNSIAQRIQNAMSITVDPVGRVVYLLGEIDEATTFRFVTAFRTLDSTPGPILITMCSPGGSINHGFAIYDTIRLATNIVAVEGTGQIMSMAAVILQAGKIRVLTPNTRFMIHQGGATVEGNTGDVIAFVKTLEQDHARYTRILADRSGKSIEEIVQLCSKDSYFTAEDAVKMGFADKMLELPPQPKIDLVTVPALPALERKPKAKTKTKKNTRRKSC